MPALPAVARLGPRPIVDLQQEPVLDARQVRVARVAHQPHPALGSGEREARQVVLLAGKLQSQCLTIFSLESPCEVLLRMCRPPGRPLPWSTAAGLPRPPHRHCCCCCRRPRALDPPPIRSPCPSDAPESAAEVVLLVPSDLQQKKKKQNTSCNSLFVFFILRRSHP